MRPTSWLDIRLRLALEQLGLIVRIAAFLLLFYLGAGVLGALDFSDEQLVATARAPR